MDMTPLILSLKAATIATILVVLIGIPISYLAAHMKRGKSIVDVICTLPMVLPPTVVGLFSVAPFWKKQHAWSMAYGAWNSGGLFSDRDGHCIGGGVLSAFVPYCKRRI